MLRKVAFIVLMVLIITMIFCFVSWSEPNPKQTISQGKTGKLSAQKTTDQIKPADNIVTNQQLIDAISRAINATAQKAKTTQNPTQSDNSTFWFSLFLVIFTGVLATVAIFQFFVLKSTLKETQVVAKAATDSAEVAEKALNIAERAYLKIDSFELVQFGTGHHINISYEIHNVGHTPAQIIESLTIVDIVDKKIPETPNYDIEKGISGPKKAFIQPTDKAAMIGISKKIVTFDEYNSVNNNNKLIFVWGKIIFSDAFGKIWINGFGAAYSPVFGITMMDGYNYTTEYKKNSESD